MFFAPSTMELEGNGLGVAHNPCVMAGRNIVGITCTIGLFSTVIMAASDLTFNNDATCFAVQLSVPTTGLMSLDHFQPG